MRALIVAGLFVATAASAAPVQLSWSGRLVDELGEPIDGTHEVNIGVFGQASGGASLYDEDVSVTFNGGYGSAVLGVPGELDSSVFQRDGLMYIGVTLLGPPDTELLPRSVISTSPRAAVAETVRLTNTSTCDEGEMGRFRTTSGYIELCTESGWMSAGAGANGHTTCASLKAANPALSSGSFSINPDGTGAFDAWCDMSTADGGWTLVVKANNGDATNFYSTPGVLTSGTTFLNETTENDVTRGDYIGQGWTRSPASELMVMDCVGGNHIRGYMPQDWPLHRQLLGAMMVDDFIYAEQCGIMAVGTVTSGTTVGAGPATHLGLACEDDSDGGWENTDDATLISWYDQAGNNVNNAHTVGIAKVGSDGGDDVINRDNSSVDACVMVFVR